MAASKITLIGLNRWMHDIEDDLFTQLDLPEGIDKDTLTNNILLQGADFEVMYSDPLFMKEAIGLWSSKWYRTFEKWVDALAIEYAPLENYDRKEDWSDTLNKGIKTSARRDSGNTRTFDNQDKRTLDTEDERTVDLTDVNEETVSAFDSSTYQPSKKNTIDQDGTDTIAHTGTDTVDYSGTITDEFGEGSSGSEIENSKTVRDGRIHGNIGVTSSQELLESELRIAQWNLYEHITDLFLSEFVIPIYS